MSKDFKAYIFRACWGTVYSGEEKEVFLVFVQIFSLLLALNMSVIAF